MYVRLPVTCKLPTSKLPVIVPVAAVILVLDVNELTVAAPLTPSVVPMVAAPLTVKELCVAAPVVTIVVAPVIAPLVFTVVNVPLEAVPLPIGVF